MNLWWVAEDRGAPCSAPAPIFVCNSQRQDNKQWVASLHQQGKPLHHVVPNHRALTFLPVSPWEAANLWRVAEDGGAPWSGAALVWAPALHTTEERQPPVPPEAPLSPRPGSAALPSLLQPQPLLTRPPASARCPCSSQPSGAALGALS